LISKQDGAKITNLWFWAGRRKRYDLPEGTKKLIIENLENASLLFSLNSFVKTKDASLIN